MRKQWFSFFLFLYCYSTLLVAESHGTLDIAVLLYTPHYEGNNRIDQFVKENERRLSLRFLTQLTPDNKRHITLSYPLIPLDEDVIALWPSVQKEVEAMPADVRTAEYQKRIPELFSAWFTTLVKNWVKTAETWKDPLLLSFLQVRQLQNHLVAEFNLDAMGRLLHIVRLIRTKISQQFPKAYFGFNDIIPHLTIGTLDPLFNVTLLTQPTTYMPPLSISKKSIKHMVVSVRIKRSMLEKMDIIEK